MKTFEEFSAGESIIVVGGHTLTVESAKVNPRRQAAARNRGENILILGLRSTILGLRSTVVALTREETLTLIRMLAEGVVITEELTEK